MTKAKTISRKKASLPLSAETLCNFILFQCKKRGIKNMDYDKLQKLSYYCHSWHLVHYNKRLLKNGFEAWLFGPVSPEIFKIYENCEDPEKLPMDNVNDNSTDIPETVREITDLVLKEYGKFSGEELSDLAHREKPWLEARGDISPIEICENPISDKVIRKYYAERIAG